MSGLALETATAHVEVAVIGAHGPLAHVVEDVGHGHTRRLAPLVRRALAEARVPAASLAWVAADLGPGSFTGVRVGLATARALALVAGARLRGASALAALAHAAPARRALLVPLVPAGRRDLYAGFFRADARGQVRLVAGPRVGTPEAVLAAVDEVRALVPGAGLRFVGPGAGRERERLEAAHPTSTALEFRHDGLSALDLARAAALGHGPGAGLPALGGEGEPLYVRPAQAEERVRHAVSGRRPVRVRALAADDLETVVALEHRLFTDPWPLHFFHAALADRSAECRAAERDGALVGYLVASVHPPVCELQNIAVAPAEQRGGVARALLADLYARLAALGVHELTLEVRVSNFAAQALYRSEGFRLAGLRRGYYRLPAEDALVMTRAPLPG